MTNHTAMNSAVLEVHPVLTPERMEKRQNGRRMKEDGEPMFTLTSQAVSYTHLDVYKRQALSNKLQQMANGAAYDESGNVRNIHDRKIDALEDLIESANGKPLLVAYWFKHDRERILKLFPARDINTKKDIEDWNEGKIPVALIHPCLLYTSRCV